MLSLVKTLGLIFIVIVCLGLGVMIPISHNKDVHDWSNHQGYDVKSISRFFNPFESPLYPIKGSDLIRAVLVNKTTGQERIAYFRWIAFVGMQTEFSN